MSSGSSQKGPVSPCSVRYPPILFIQVVAKEESIHQKNRVYPFSQRRVKSRLVSRRSWSHLSIACRRSVGSGVVGFMSEAKGVVGVVCRNSVGTFGEGCMSKVKVMGGSRVCTGMSTVCVSLSLLLLSGGKCGKLRRRLIGVASQSRKIKYMDWWIAGSHRNARSCFGPQSEDTRRCKSRRDERVYTLQVLKVLAVPSSVLMGAGGARALGSTPERCISPARWTLPTLSVSRYDAIS